MRLEEELRAARVRTEDAENEAIRWRKQAQQAHDELQAQTVQFHQRISQRERELDSLRHQVLLKSGTGKICYYSTHINSSSNINSINAYKLSVCMYKNLYCINTSTCLYSSTNTYITIDDHYNSGKLLVAL